MLCRVGVTVVAVKCGGMTVSGSSCWSLASGLEKGDVNRYQEGIQTMQVLAQNMAWLMKKLCG
jgi:hypothetical protein